MAFAQKRVKSWPWANIAIGIGALALIGGAFFFTRRPKQGGPLVGRKLYEENLREVHEFLQKVLDGQRRLVKNPPVVRSFRRDIEGFKTRLDNLEGSAKTIEALSGQIIGALGEIDKVVRTISSVESRLSREIASTQKTLEAKNGQIEAKVEAIQGVLPRLEKADESLHRDVQTNAAKASTELHALSEALKAGLMGEELRSEERRLTLDLMQQSINGLHTKLEAVEQLQSTAADELKQAAGRTDSLHTQLGAALQKQQSEVVEKLEGATKAHSDRADSLEQNLQALAIQVDALSASAKESDRSLSDRFGALSAGLDEALRDAAARSDALMAELSAVRESSTTDQLEARLGELESAVNAHVTGAIAKGAEDIAKLSHTVASSSDAQSARLKELETALNASLSTVQTRSAEGIAELSKAIDASSKNLEAMLANDRDATKALGDTLNQTVAELKLRVDEFAELWRGSDASGADRSKALRTEIESVAKATNTLGESLQRLESRSQELGAALAEQAARLSAFENLERAVAALREDLVVMTSTGATKSEVSEQAKKLASSQSLRLEQLSQDVHQVQQSLQQVAAIGSAVQEVSTRLEELASRPVEAPQVIVPAGTDASPELLAGFSSLQQELRSLGSLAQAVEQLRNKVEAQEKPADVTPLVAGLQDSVNQLREKIDGMEQPVDVSSAVQDIQAELSKVSNLRETVDQLRVELRQEIANTSVSLKEGADQVAAKLLETESKVDALANRPTPVPIIEKQQPAAPPKLELVVKATMQHESEVSAKTVEDVEEEALPKQRLVIESSNDDAADTAESLPIIGRKMPWNGHGGTGARSWSVEAPQLLTTARDLAGARAPTTTVDPSAPIGAAVFTGDSILYSHGETLRSYWPGMGERMAEFDEAIPADSRRIVQMDEQLFVAGTNSVEILDLETWKSMGSFKGTYLDQIATSFHWVGVQPMNGMLAIDYRNVKGKQVGQPRITNASASEPFFLTVAANAVFLGSSDGRLFRATEQGVEAIGQLDGKLLGVAGFGANFLCLTDTKTGVKAHLNQVGDKPRRTIELHTESVFENSVVLGERWFIADQSAKQLRSINIPKWKQQDAFDVAGGDAVLAMAGTGKGNECWIAIATAGQKQQAGTVRLLNGNTGESTSVCPINHKDVRLVFANGYLVVITGSTYQSMIRVFDPFGLAAKRIEQAA